MLSLANISVEMGLSYYEKDDYYSRENGPGKPEFFGKGMAILGLKRAFDEEVFENLLRGYSPDGKERIGQHKRKPFEKGTFLLAHQVSLSDLDEIPVSEKCKKDLIEIFSRGSLRRAKKDFQEYLDNSLIDSKEVQTSLNAFESPKVSYGEDRKVRIWGVSVNDKNIHNLLKNKGYYWNAIEGHWTTEKKTFSNKILKEASQLIKDFADYGISLKSEINEISLIRESVESIFQGSERSEAIYKLERDLEKYGVGEKQRKELLQFIDDKIPQSFHLHHDESKQLQHDLKALFRKLPISRKTEKMAMPSMNRFIKKVSLSSRRAGIDATFSAPKSVSLKALVEGDKELLDAHKKAVKYALKLVEDRHIFTLSGNKKERIPEKTGIVIGALFHHGTSRELDPQLHTHCPIFNMTMDSSGKWKAIHNDEIYKTAKLLGVIYQNKLAKLTQDLGYEIEVKNNGTFELKGYRKDQLEYFSKRSQQMSGQLAKKMHLNKMAIRLDEMNIQYKIETINSQKTICLNNRDISKNLNKNFQFKTISNDKTVILDLLGNDSFEKNKATYLKEIRHRDKRAEVLINRKAKKEISLEEIQENWQQESKKINLAHPQKVKVIRNNHIDYKFAPEHLGERSHVWEINNLKLETIKRNLGQVSFEEIEANINSKSKIVELKKEKITDKKRIDIETQNLMLMTLNKNIMSPIANLSEISEIPQEKGYSKCQRGAFIKTMTSKDFVTGWFGVADCFKLKIFVQIL